MVSTIDQVVALVTAICQMPGNETFIRDTNRAAKAGGLREVVSTRDTPALFDWLVDSFSYQGISDRIAADYIAAHGNASWWEIESALGAHTCPCPKLRSFATYQ